MISFKEFILREEFDSVSDFLLNPKPNRILRHDDVPF
jgi:hypothetical protein